MKCNKIVLLIVVSITVITAFDHKIQCKDPKGRSVDWFTAIKLPNLYSNVSDGTVYIYMDAENMEWTYLTNITSQESAVGHTVSQMYVPTNQNDSIMWLVYNNQLIDGNVTFTLGHTKGTVIADSNSGFWLVHSVPRFPQLPYQNNNSYTYPKTGLKFGQSFLCISMTAQELDKVGNQLINNEAMVFGSHFGNNLKEVYPSLYNSTLSPYPPNKENDRVRLQHLKSIKGFPFLSVSKNRYFGKDMYEYLITNLTKSNVYTETWMNSKDAFHSSCFNQYKTMNIKSLVMKDIKGFEGCWFNSHRDHSKWTITDKASVPWTCIGDVNRAGDQLNRGGGTVCINSATIWNQYNKLVSTIEKCAQ